jgi:hypothetical protein
MAWIRPTWPRWCGRGAPACLRGPCSARFALLPRPSNNSNSSSSSSSSKHCRRVPMWGRRTPSRTFGPSSSCRKPTSPPRHVLRPLPRATSTVRTCREGEGTRSQTDTDTQRHVRACDEGRPLCHCTDTRWLCGCRRARGGRHRTRRPRGCISSGKTTMSDSRATRQPLKRVRPVHERERGRDRAARPPPHARTYICTCMHTYTHTTCTRAHAPMLLSQCLHGSFLLTRTGVGGSGGGAGRAGDR